MIQLDANLSAVGRKMKEREREEPRLEMPPKQLWWQTVECLLWAEECSYVALGVRVRAGMPC